MIGARSSWQSHAPMLAAFLLCTFHFFSFDFQNAPLITDTRYYMYFAWRITEGDVPHLDLFDNKTQLTSYVGAALFLLGEGLGVDPLMAIRVGYLALVTGGGLLSFVAFRRLEGNLGGVLAAVAYCSFAFVGMMTAIGNLPKLWMPVCATAVALLVHRRHWFWAGAAGGLAFMDWQIGVLAWIAAFVTAVTLERSWRAVCAVMAGGTAAVGPFVLYYALTGALQAAFSQVVLASLFRGASVAHMTLELRLWLIERSVRLGCPDDAGLFVLGWLGVGVVGVWLARRRGDPLRLLLPLAVYHFGLLLFSLYDFQRYGDLYVLLHTSAFFLAALWIALARGAQAIAARWGAGRNARWGVAAACVGVALGIARPGPFASEIFLPNVNPSPYRGADLTDQRQVAAILGDATEGRSLVFLEHSELLLLMRRENGLPTIFWNQPTLFEYRISPQESIEDAAARMVRAADPEILIVPRPRFHEDPETGESETIGLDLSPLMEGFQVKVLRSRNGRFEIVYGDRGEG